jgi:hypothetical protein
VVAIHHQVRRCGIVGDELGNELRSGFKLQRRDTSIAHRKIKLRLASLGRIRLSPIPKENELTLFAQTVLVVL